MSTEYAFGREQIALITSESVFGTLVQPAAADAINVLSCGFTPGQARKDRLQNGSTRSITKRTTGR